MLNTHVSYYFTFSLVEMCITLHKIEFPMHILKYM